MIIKDDNQIIDDKCGNLQKRDNSWHKENGAENVTSGRIVFPVNDDLEEMRRLDKKEEEVEVKKMMEKKERMVMYFLMQRAGQSKKGMERVPPMWKQSMAPAMIAENMEMVEEIRQEIILVQSMHWQLMDLVQGMI